MAKKKAKKKAQGPDILASAHNIWLAGLGAVAAASEEGGKLFNELVERGKGVEVQLSAPMERAGDSLRGTVKVVQERAGKTLRSIEGAVDDQVGAALGKIGVPTRDEVAALKRRIEKLTRDLTGGGAKKKKRRGRSPHHQQDRVGRSYEAPSRFLTDESQEAKTTLSDDEIDEDRILRALRGD